MTRMNRRRFMVISAGVAGLAAFPAGAATLTHWRGIALGAQASISLAHPDAEAIIARAVAEIARLEAVFSLYRADSAVMRLNATGVLDAPPPELLQCLALCGRVHAATGGLFDPTVQPLWAAYAEGFAAGAAPDADAIADAVARVGWHRVVYDSAAVRLAAGMQLTLNGVAQGFIADRVADLLRAEGLSDILINTGELRALGGDPSGGGWPVQIDGAGKIALQDRALASSSPLGTVFDTAGTVGHILDPHTGLPAQTRWRRISVSAPHAAVADALSTACCLMVGADMIAQAVARFPDARLEHLS